MNFEWIILSLLFLIMAGLGLLLFLIYDTRKEFVEEVKEQKATSKAIEKEIIDGVMESKDWIENQIPVSLDNIDLSALTGVDGNILTNILGDKSYFTNLFATMLSDDSELLQLICKTTKIPPMLAKPIMTNVMAGIAGTINNMVTNRIVGKIQPTKNNEKDETRLEPFRKKKIKQGF